MGQVRDLAAPDGHDTQGPGSSLQYMRVVDEIIQWIEVRNVAPGTRMLSERALAQEYGVAYGTVRRAMKVLRERDIIYTRHGRGTFVADPAHPEHRTLGP